MCADKSRVIVVVPLYTTKLSADDVMSLQRTIAVLGKHPLAIICPEGLDLSPLDNLLHPGTPAVERFPPTYFKGVEGYNQLMLSTQFYSRFAAYEYLLICQTDVFVFEDKLEYWCGRGYDYIGAPWIGSPRNAFNKLMFGLTNLLRRRKRSEEQLFKVGNGGFSLRKVAMMQRIVAEQRTDIEHALANPNRHRHHIEDVYFSLLARKKIPEMRIPDYVEAVDFCIDRKPALAISINGGRLPFACHGFNKPKVRGFWAPILANIASQRTTGIAIEASSR
ncbi:MAG TPA: DUF5672 family protein [Steroidobacter sp.]